MRNLPPLSLLPLLALLAPLLLIPAAAQAEGDVVEEVLQILRDRGDITEAKHAELKGRHEKHTAKQKGLLGRIQLSGDIRGRYENFFFSEDALGNKRRDRNRGRYRIRIAGKAAVNQQVKVGFRLATGGDHDSTNQSFGSNGNGGDGPFGSDGIHMDRAYIELTPFAENNAKFIYGKQGNPFLWKNGKDYMLFDGDLDPEGAALKWQGGNFFANAGYFVIDEESTNIDPHMFGIQGGFKSNPGANLELGGRLSYYTFNSLRNKAGSVIGDGNTSFIGDADGNGIAAWELAGYLKHKGSANWPLLAYFHYAQNTSARTGPSGNKDDTGFGLGVELGNSKKIAKLGAGYYRLEANFFPGQLIDSDVFDGKTNREGFTLYASRNIWENTDLGLTLFFGNELEHDASGYYDGSVANADRVRIQSDLKVKF